MIGKNNYYLKNTKEGTKVESYSIKKFKVGAASVVIGASIFFGAGAVAHASEDISNNTATDKKVNDEISSSDNKLVAAPKAQAKPVVENTRESVAAVVASKLENSEKETLNKTALIKLIEEIDGKFTNGKYASKTEESVNQLKAALEEARTVLNNAKTQDELKKAYARLSTATTQLKTKLKEKKVAPEVDTTNGKPTVGIKATNTEKSSDSNSIANSGSRDERSGKVLDKNNPFRTDGTTTDTDPSANQTYTVPAENADLNTLAEKLKTLPNVIENNKKVQDMDTLGNALNVEKGSVTEIKEFGGWKAVGDSGKFAIARKTESGVFPAYTVNINRTNRVWVREQSFDRSSEYILLLSKLVTKQNRTETVYDDLPYKDNNESGAQTARAAKWFDGIEKTFKAYAKDEGTKVKVSFRTGYTGDNNGSKAKYKVEVFSIENGTEKSIYTAVVSPETTVNNSEMNVVAARDGNARNETFTANGFTKEQIEEKLALPENRPNATGGTFTSKEINLPKGVTSYKVRISLQNKHQAGMSYNSSYLQYSLPITGLDFNVNQDTSIIAKNLLQRIYNKLLETETADKAGKTDATITAYTEELEKVKTLLEGELKTTTDYKTAFSTLLAKQEALVPAATNDEKTSLSAQVEGLKKVSTDTKTPKSIAEYNKEFEKYNQEIESIRQEVTTIINKQGNATKDEVRNALEKVEVIKGKLDTAARLLVEQGNKTELRKAVGEETTVKGNFKYYNADKTTRDAYDEAIKNGQKVINDADADQTEVDAAKQAIEDAKAALTGAATNKEALTTATNEAKAAKTTDAKYYNETDATKKQAYDEAITQAETVLNNPNATQEAVNNAKQAIIDAKNALTGAATNKEALTTATNEAKAAKTTDAKYYNETDATKKQAYDEAITQAETVLNNPNATQEAVNNAKQAIIDAKNVLTGVATNKEALREASTTDANTTKTTDTKYYNATAEKKKAYDDAVTAAAGVISNNNATQAQVDEALRAITEAKQALNGATTNKEALRKASTTDANTTKTTDAKYYNATVEKKKAYDDAVTAAAGVLSNDNATQAQVDEALRVITEAKQALNGATTNKEALRKASTTDAENTKTTDAKYYNATAEKKKAYDDAVTAAAGVLSNDNATQAQVDEALRVITEAKQALNGATTNKEALTNAANTDAEATKEKPEYYNADAAKKAAYDKAVADAAPVLAKENATQAQVDAVKQAIEDAKAALNGVETHKIDPAINEVDEFDLLKLLFKGIVVKKGQDLTEKDIRSKLNLLDGVDIVEIEYPNTDTLGKKVAKVTFRGNDGNLFIIEVPVEVVGNTTNTEEINNNRRSEDKTSKNTLPNTGATETNTGLAGVGMAILGGLLAVARRRKEK